MFVSSMMRVHDSRGMPIISQMIWSGSTEAISATKSHSPLPATAASTPRALTCTSSSMRATILGVNDLDTMRRRRVWRGASMLIIEP